MTHLQCVKGQNLEEDEIEDIKHRILIQDLQQNN
jgi:hypothetical protein